MNKLLLAMTGKARRTLLLAALRAIDPPLRAASALTWWLEGIRARIQTALANEEDGR